MGAFILTEDQKEQFNDLLQKRCETLSKDDNDLGYTEAVKHAIKFQDDVLVRCPHCRIPPQQMQIVEGRQLIKKHLDRNTKKQQSLCVSRKKEK